LSGGEQFAARVAEFFQTGLGFGFDITTNQRLGAAGAKRHPFVVRQKKFETVGGDKFFKP